MAKIPRDISFVRDGVPLSIWLQRLVSEDTAEQKAAADAIRVMQAGLPSLRTSFRDIEPDFDFEEHKERFEQAIRNAVNDPVFDTADFMRRICALTVAADRAWLEQVEAKGLLREARDKRYERLADKLTEKIKDATDDDAQIEAIKRFTRLSAAYICGGKGNSPKLDPEAVGQGAACLMVFGALGPEIMAAPEGVEALLESKLACHKGLKLLTRAGTVAISFAPKLLARIDNAGESNHQFASYEDAGALGSIGCGNAHVVDALMERISSPHACIRATAAIALGNMHPGLCNRNQAIIAELRFMLDLENSDVFIGPLASVGRDDPAIRKMILDMAQPQPPRVIHHPDVPSYEYDINMHRRGVAIDALSHFKDYPAECLPALIGAIETFVEFDADIQHFGPVARVAWVIKHFGPNAASAAVPLARHLADEEVFPMAILEALAALGPAARDAIPLLEAYRLKRNGGDANDLDNAKRPSRKSDPIGWTIWQISRPDQC